MPNGTDKSTRKGKLNELNNNTSNKKIPTKAIINVIPNSLNEFAVSSERPPKSN